MECDRIFTLPKVQRHPVISDLNAGSGLLTFKAWRWLTEGGVYAYTRTSTEAIACPTRTASNTF